MEWITSESHTFVIRLWLEESSWESNSPSWRGHITHYPSGNRRYVSDLDEIAAFILLFLEEMGVAGKSANRAPPAEASRKPHQIAPGTDWQSVGKATGSDDSEGEREMIQWTWSFNGTNASDSTKTTMEGTLWVDGLDKFDVEVPGWQTRQVEILPSSLSCIEFIGVQWAKEKPAARAASPPR